MGPVPTVLSPDLAARMIDAIGVVEAGPRNRPTLRALGPAGVGMPGQWLTVSSTTVTSGTQPGNLQTYNAASDTWTAGAAIRIKQVNGYVLQTGVYLRGFLAGLDGSGNVVFATSDQTGSSTGFKACNSGGTAAVTVTEQNGVITSVA